jgi:hypothetical protein
MKPTIRPTHSWIKFPKLAPIPSSILWISLQKLDQNYICRQCMQAVVGLSSNYIHPDKLQYTYKIYPPGTYSASFVGSSTGELMS